MVKQRLSSCNLINLQTHVSIKGPEAVFWTGLWREVGTLCVSQVAVGVSLCQGGLTQPPYPPLGLSESASSMSTGSKQGGDEERRHRC